MSDYSTFQLLNVSDTCSLWNVLASPTLYTRSRSAGVRLCCTDFVVYECLHKASRDWPERPELQQRLRSKIADGSIASFPIELDDLQQVEILRNRKKLSLGELSVMVFARKTQQAMLTDDKGAQRVAREHLGADSVQSTPHLLGWLYFGSLLADEDVSKVKADFASLSRNLGNQLDEAHRGSQQFRVMVMRATSLQQP